MSADCGDRPELDSQLCRTARPGQLSVVIGGKLKNAERKKRTCVKGFRPDTQ